MNEQLKKLVQQAKGSNQNLIWEDAELERFAELVRADERELAKPELPRAFREVLIGNNYILRFHPSDTVWMCGISNEMMDAIEEMRNENAPLP